MIWIQESTMGWARVQELLANRMEVLLANILQMLRSPALLGLKTSSNW